ncbi:hypothetical protein SY83_07755 [Paenibacillus swuensis]|uniref:Uncharacterized protein n=1 Tax=Paenibacillus swuensis TaxID=1178515 RepID=A0A172TGT3_9BACL|nr:hypothetical protein [Paenibacillus swuensis]ANE46182.1 hypothetical protein SY83_07755 [Paenibacillus swuensis]
MESCNIQPLKELETYGYQIAYYLLQNEAMATAAMQNSLKILFQDQTFHTQSLTGRQQQMKKVVMKQSLQQLASKITC